MRPGWCCIVVLLAASPLTLAGDDDGPAKDGKVLTLWKAEVRGHLLADARVLGSHRTVTLILTNTTSRDIAIDVCGTVLKPLASRLQRLALGPAKRGKRLGPGTSVVVVPSLRRVCFRVGAVGLDPGLPLPISWEYAAAGNELPPEQSRLLRWWADHPTCEQRLVENALAKGLDQVPVKDGEPPPTGTPAGRFALSGGGVYYTLARGELSSVDASGARKVLASDVFRAFPLPGCLYAIRAVKSGPPGLQALGITGEGEWESVADFSVEDPEDLRRITPGPEGRLLVVTRSDLRLWSRKDREQTVTLEVEDCLEVSTCVEPTGRVLIAVNRLRQDNLAVSTAEESRCELWEILPGKKKARLVKTFWEVRSLAAGTAGVYGLYKSGTLRRLHRNNLESISSQTRYGAILRVGRKGLWLADEEGEIVYVDARSGRVKLWSGVKIENVVSLDIDPETDDLAFTRGEEFCRMRPAGKGVEVIRGSDD